MKADHQNTEQKYIPQELRDLGELTTRSLHLRAESINEDNRSIDAAISTENPVMVFDWNRFEPVMEILLSSGRDNNAKQVVMLDTHRRYGISDVIGSIRDIRTENNEVVGRLNFASDSTKAAEAWNLVKQGHLTDVSAGYRVLKYTDIAPGQSATINNRTFKNEFEIPLRVSTKWSLREGSLVPIGADEASKIKRELQELYQQRSAKPMENEEKKETQVTVTAPAAPPVDVEKLERETREKEVKRYSELVAIGENFNMIPEAQKAYRDGVSVEGFRKQVLETLKTNQHIDTKAAELDLSDKDKSKYSLGNVFRSLIMNDPNQAAFEWEVSRALEKKLDRKPSGIYIPHEVMVGDPYRMAARTLTAASGAASLVGTDHLAGSFIELLRNRVVLQNMGVLTLTGLQGDISIPRQTGAATGGWLATEASSATPSDQTFDSVTLTPKNAYGDTLFARQALLQSNPSIEALVMADLIAVLARAIDYGGINGSGASGEPTGLLNTSGIGTVTGTSINWEGVVEFETDVAESNADDLASMYYLMRPSVRGILKTRAKDAGSGLFLMEANELNGYPSMVSTQVPVETLIFGAFSQIIQGFWGALDLMINPYLYAVTRVVAIHATQTTDVAVRHVAAFSASEDIS